MDAPPNLVPEPGSPLRTPIRLIVRVSGMPQVEVITRGERRRVWTLEQKQEIVAESLGSTLDADGSGRASMASSSGLL